MYLNIEITFGRIQMGKKHRMNQWDVQEERSRDQRDQEGEQEGLNEYIRVTGPGTLAVILSLLILLVSMIVWGFVGTLPVTETVTGLVIDTGAYDKINQTLADQLLEGEEGILVLCFVDASRYNGQALKEFGDEVGLKMPDQTTFSGTIETWYQAPVSMEEAKELLFGNGWLLEKCVSQDYNWLLVIRPKEDLSKYTFTLAEVTILTEEVAPIRFLMK
jgi:hypothetical protein